MKLKLFLITTFILGFLTTTQNINNTILNEETETIKFKEAKNPPVAPGCELITDLEENKKCTNQFIQRHLAQKFMSNLGTDVVIKGKTKINIGFIVDEKGKVIRITANGGSETMNQNAVKVVGLLPVMKPGTKDGKPVKVSFTTTLQIESAD